MSAEFRNGAFPFLSCVACACGVVTLAWADAREAIEKPLGAVRAQIASKSTKTASVSAAKPARVDALSALAQAREQGDRLVSDDARGRRIELTIAPGLQRRITKLFADYRVPYGALVAIEPSTGRVLAYVSHSSANPDAPDLARDVTPPAASVFKLVTASALLERGIGPETKVCYGGGSSRLENVDLKDDARRDRACASLSDALGRSINAVFAKLADRNLNPEALRRSASAFGFGQPPPFEADAVASPAEVPKERLEFARSAAGFWHVHMSPLHGALIAAMIANDGQMPNAVLIDRVTGADGRPIPLERRAPPKASLQATTAKTLTQMMLRTVRNGTAHSAFYDSRGRPLLGDIDVAGKTGSLSSNNPYRAYSWWVGFAPADKPTIALAALVVNTPIWRIKSSFVARSALEEYLAQAPKVAPVKIAPRPAPSRGPCKRGTSCGSRAHQTR